LADIERLVEDLSDAVSTLFGQFFVRVVAAHHLKLSKELSNETFVSGNAAQQKKRKRVIAAGVILFYDRVRGVVNLDDDVLQSEFCHVFGIHGSGGTTHLARSYSRHCYRLIA
jgi:hypothetical protein